MEDLTGERDRSIDGLCVFPLCDRPQTDYLRLPVCERHILKTYRLANQMIQDAIPPAEQGNRFSTRKGALDTDPGLVYFLRLGTMVKIGFTTNLTLRLKALPHEEVLATIPGSMRDEKALHRQFSHLRVTGEWFRHEGDLSAFILDVKEAA